MMWFCDGLVFNYINVVEGLSYDFALWQCNYETLDKGALIMRFFQGGKSIQIKTWAV